MTIQPDANMNRTLYNPVIKDTTTFIHLAAETGNAYTEVEVTLMPGGGTPLHYHKQYAETFQVSDGELTITLGNKSTIVLKAGMRYTVERGVHHRFFNATDVPVIFNVVITPGSPGFEQSLRMMYGLATDGQTNAKSIPRNWRHLAVIMAISDMNAPGILSLLAPVFKWYAQTRSGKSMERLLNQKYCRSTPARPSIV